MRSAQTTQTSDRDLESLAAAKDAWAQLPIARKVAMLEAVKRTVHSIAADWAAAASNAKGLLPGSPLAGEEWISGPWAVLYALNRYMRTLRQIDAHGEPDLCAITPGPGGRAVVRVFPHDLYDRVLLGGITAQVWMQPGVTPEQTRACAASFYRRQRPEGTLALVLGAGNISSIAPLDVLYELIARGAVCMLKLNPVNDYLGPIFERALEPFVEAGFLRFAYGGADTGAYFCAHEAVQQVHITGSERTHDAIVAAIASSKPITSELGNVSPTIVMPGNWSAADLRFQAENIATQKAHNAGFNCVAAQVLLLPRDWEHSRTLHEHITQVFQRMEQRPEYYPGAAERRTAIAGPGSALRCAIEVDAGDLENPALKDEAFCGVLACVRLPGDTESYVREAVAFANERLRGTLGANIVVHPATMREKPSVIDYAIESLRYGCVAVNAWTGVGYFINETPWGAYPGHTLADVQSGIGVVHNSYLLEQTEKSIVRGPFAPFPRSLRSGEFALLPKPPWFVTNRMQAAVGRALCDFELARSPAAAAKIAALAIRG